MRLLLIENRQPLLAALTKGFAKKGFEIDVAHDGDSGDTKARTAHYDAIVFNLTLDEGAGPERLLQWRRAGVNAPVIVLTSREEIADGVRSLDYGAGDFLTFPFEPEELFARLTTLIHRQRTGNKTTMHIHDLEIDAVGHTVKRQGQRIRLTPREYALLDLLVRHRGRVVSRSMIWKNLYDEHDRNTSNVIDVYIRYLRQKIDQGFEPPLILTRWGEGYLLRGD